jgi:hypothetical protein
VTAFKTRFLRTMCTSPLISLPLSLSSFILNMEDMCSYEMIVLCVCSERHRRAAIGVLHVVHRAGAAGPPASAAG